MIASTFWVSMIMVDYVIIAYNGRIYLVSLLYYIQLYSGCFWYNNHVFCKILSSNTFERVHCAVERASSLHVFDVCTELLTRYFDIRVFVCFFFALVLELTIRPK